jgi:hypothetical protein
MRVAGTYLGDAEALVVVGFAERVLRCHPDAAAFVTPELRGILAELNTAAHAERNRRANAAFRSRLVPVTEAARRLGLSPRTIRWRAATGRLPAERDENGRWLVEACG